MSQPRTRSQGPPDVDGSKETKPSTATNPSTAKRRMSQELQVKLKVLKLHPVTDCKGSETSQASMKIVPTSVTLRPLSTIPPASRPNSAMGTAVTREVSAKFN